MAEQSLAFSITHFGFRRRPFQGNGVDFLRAHPGYEDTYNQLLDGIRFKRGLILLLGEPGTGKSLLLGNLAHDPSVGLGIVFCSALQDFDSLLSSICAHLKLEVAGPQRPYKLKALKEYMSTALGEGLVVLIDNADQLDESTLRSILNLTKLSNKEGRSLTLVLAGPVQLEQRLAALRHISLIVNRAVAIHLKPLSEAQAAEFIHKQLQIAGTQPDQLFSSAVTERIAGYSRGMPRLLNRLCSRALAIAEATGQTSVSAAMVDAAARDLNLNEPSSQAGSPESIPDNAAPPAGAPGAAAPAPPGQWLHRLGPRRRRIGLALGIGILAIGSGVWLWSKHPESGQVTSSQAPGTTLPVLDTPPGAALSSGDYIRNGDRMLKVDNVTAARDFYDKAAALGDVKGMTALGKTYDPLVLQEHGLSHLPIDPIKAAEWYLKAGQAGDIEALERLDQLLNWLDGKPAYAQARLEILQRLSR